MIKNSKTIFVKKKYDLDYSYQMNINLDFIPHEMIVKKIDLNIFTGEDGDDMLFIRSNLVNDYIGYTRNLAVNVSNELQTRFLLNRPIRGVYDFTVHNDADKYESITGQLVICLEFIEYVK